MSARDEARAQGREGRPRVLIMDQDPRIAEALALAFQRQARVEWAASGLAGLIVAAEREVDLVIIEANLSDVSRADLLRLLRILRPGAPIAILGTSRESEVPGEARPDARFPRPFDLKPFLAWIADHISRGGAGSPEQPPSAQEAPMQHIEIVRWVLEFIERHYQEGTSLAVIAQAAGVSRSHLCRIFKRVTGLSLKRFLTRRRLQGAKAMLRETGAPIYQVALKVGYRDSSHFDRVFRQWEGQTPSRYRRQTELRRLG